MLVCINISFIERCAHRYDHLMADDGTINELIHKDVNVHSHGFTRVTTVVIGWREI